MGAKLAVEDNREVPETLEAMWTYPGGTLVTLSQLDATPRPATSAMEFRGTTGTVHLGYDGYEIVPESNPEGEFPALNPLDRRLSRSYQQNRKASIAERAGKGADGTPLHARSFLDCVRSRARCTCDVETGHRSTTAALVVNVALRRRALLEWDAKAERFTNDDEANRLLVPSYRAPYALPEV